MADLTALFGRRQAVLNTATTGLLFGLLVVSGIFFTPYLLGRIGSESYGLVMLAVVVVSYASPLVQTLSTTLAREFALARASGEPGALQALLDRGMALCLRLALVLGLALALVALVGPHLLGISAPFRFEASVILALTGLSFLVWVIGAPFAAILYVANRLDLANHAQLAQLLLRVGGAVIILELLWGSPYSVPVAALAGSVILVAWAIAASAAISPLRVGLHRTWRSAPLNLGGTGAAVLLGTVAAALLLGGSLAIVSNLFGERETGYYAAAIQIPVLIRTALTSLSGVFGPQIITHTSEQNLDKARGATAEAVRWLGLLTAFPVGVLLVAAPMVLKLWLGPSFVQYAWVLRVEALCTLFYVTGLPLYTLVVAAGRAMWPCAFRALAAVIFVGLAIVLYEVTALGPVAIAVALAVAMLASELLFLAPSAARAIRVGAGAFFQPYLAVGVSLAGAAGATAALLALWTPQTIVELLVFGCAVGLVHFALAALLFGRREIIDMVDALRNRRQAAAD